MMEQAMLGASAAISLQWFCDNVDKTLYSVSQPSLGEVAGMPAQREAAALGDA
jgi:hypothetical protein